MKQPGAQILFSVLMAQCSCIHMCPSMSSLTFCEVLGFLFSLYFWDLYTYGFIKWETCFPVPPQMSKTRDGHAGGAGHTNCDKKTNRCWTLTLWLDFSDFFFPAAAGSAGRDKKLHLCRWHWHSLQCHRLHLGPALFLLLQQLPLLLLLLFFLPPSPARKSVATLNHQMQCCWTSTTRGCSNSWNQEPATQEPPLTKPDVVVTRASSLSCWGGQNPRSSESNPKKEELGPGFLWRWVEHHFHLCLKPTTQSLTRHQSYRTFKRTPLSRSRQKKSRCCWTPRRHCTKLFNNALSPFLHRVTPPPLPTLIPYTRPKTHHEFTTTCNNDYEIPWKKPTTKRSQHAYMQEPSRARGELCKARLLARTRETGLRHEAASTIRVRV